MGTTAYVAFLAVCYLRAGSASSGLPAPVGTSPPTCLGDLALLSRSSSQVQCCKPNRFTYVHNLGIIITSCTFDQFFGIYLCFGEVEFKMKFECFVTNYWIDQGVRLEVGIRDSQTTNWHPVRFYAANITVPTTYTSLVTLNPDNAYVMAIAHRYTSSFPLKIMNAGQDLIVKEYLCGMFVDALLDTSKNLRFRWMQRYGTQSALNQAPWIVDDVVIKSWNGSCFSEIIREDFRTCKPKGV